MDCDFCKEKIWFFQTSTIQNYEGKDYTLHFKCIRRFLDQKQVKLVDEILTNIKVEGEENASK